MGKGTTGSKQEKTQILTQHLVVPSELAVSNALKTLEQPHSLKLVNSQFCVETNQQFETPV